jgi:hypothetical protein
VYDFLKPFYELPKFQVKIRQLMIDDHAKQQNVFIQAGWTSLIINGSWINDIIK